MRRGSILGILTIAGAILCSGAAIRAAETVDVELSDAKAVGAEVDRLILEELANAGIEPAGRASDEDFLRRITLDLAGTLPTPREVTLFGLDPTPDKRARVIEKLLAGDDYADNWSRYWRDVIFTNATDMRSRLSQGPFQTWLADELEQNRPWDEIATELLTATGDVREDGRTALLFAHGGQPAELAAETSRIFLGIQIQCANCHDHPSDVWTREQFHELAAYFPRIGVRRVTGETGNQRSFEIVSVNQARRSPAANFRENAPRIMQTFDRNRDRKLTKQEVARGRLARVFDRLLQAGDKNKDGALSLAEMRSLPDPPQQVGRGSEEYYMPDLDDPASRGRKVDPAFFVDETDSPSGLSDLGRREALANLMTAAENPWFARAFVNRIWSELLGEGFYMPIDDLGPSRSARYPQVLDLLARGFTASGYDVKWLFRTIANSETYQREVRASRPSTVSLPFAAAKPTRLRADQLYNAIFQVLGVQESGRAPRTRGSYRGPGGPRAQFNQLFGFDPSKPQDEITGDVPQSLFMMNSRLLSSHINAQGNTRLARLLRDLGDNDDAVSELYLLVLSREPSEEELRVCQGYIREVGQRGEAFEDLMWSLLNSSEFLTKR